MPCKHFLALCLLGMGAVVSAQNRSFDFDGFQTADHEQNWNSTQRTTSRKVSFRDDEKIELFTDRQFLLTVICKTNLPDKGAVYRCKDQKGNDVTVTIISNRRLFLYSGKLRYKVDFNPPLIAKTTRSYADLD